MQTFRSEIFGTINEQNFTMHYCVLTITPRRTGVLSSGVDCVVGCCYCWLSTKDPTNSAFNTTKDWSLE
jgi:hypothetical protein